jgi:hypothetical protein
MSYDEAEIETEDEAEGVVAVLNEAGQCTSLTAEVDVVAIDTNDRGGVTVSPSPDSDIALGEVDGKVPAEVEAMELGDDKPEPEVELPDDNGELDIIVLVTNVGVVPDLRGEKGEEVEMGDVLILNVASNILNKSSLTKGFDKNIMPASANLLRS